MQSAVLMQIINAVTTEATTQEIVAKEAHRPKEASFDIRHFAYALGYGGGKRSVGTAVNWLSSLI